MTQEIAVFVKFLKNLVFYNIYIIEKKNQNKEFVMITKPTINELPCQLSMYNYSISMYFLSLIVDAHDSATITLLQVDSRILKDLGKITIQDALVAKTPFSVVKPSGELKSTAQRYLNRICSNNQAVNPYLTES